MRILILATCVMVSAVSAANSFCGRLTSVRATFHDEAVVTGLVFKDPRVEDHSATAYDDRYMTIRNANNNVTNGADVAELVDTLVSKTLGVQNLAEWIDDNGNPWSLNVWVCLDGFERSERRTNGRVEQRANGTRSIDIKVKRKRLYKGPVAQGNEIIRRLRNISWNEDQIRKLQLQVKENRDELKKYDRETVDSLKSLLGL